MFSSVGRSFISLSFLPTSSSNRAPASGPNAPRNAPPTAPKGPATADPVIAPAIEGAANPNDCAPRSTTPAGLSMTSFKPPRAAENTVPAVSTNPSASLYSLVVLPSSSLTDSISLGVDSSLLRLAAAAKVTAVRLPVGSSIPAATIMASLTM